MAVVQRDPKPGVDAPPLWLPRHDAVVIEQSAAAPPDVVEGYTLQTRVMAALLGSTWKMVTVGATAASIVLFLAMVPSLLGGGVGAFVGTVVYQIWTVALMMLIATRVRSIGVGSVVRYWLVGFFLIAMIASFIGGPLIGLSEQGDVWIAPLLEEVLKAAPLAVAVIMGRRAWRHPGLSDLMILGFSVGAGYSLHEEALWERFNADGFGLGFGLFVPSAARPDGLLVVGQAVWTSLIALAIGLLILHRRQAVAVVAAVVLVLVAVGDHMAVNGGDGTLDSVRQLLFNGKITALIFLAAFGAAVALDQRRLQATAARDHLFPSDHTHGPSLTDEPDDDPLAAVLAARYRRLRNGVHTTADAATQQWPPRSEAHPAPLAELARLGRAADVAVGPGTSPYGWARDPEAPDGHRFVGPDGFTAYAAGERVLEPPLAAIPMPDPEAEGPVAPPVSAVNGPVGPTTTSISTPKARPEAAGARDQQRSPDFWQHVGFAAVGVVVYVVARLFTAGAASDTVLSTPISLSEATNSPALIIGVLGALAAGAALRGRDAPVVNEGWEVGPGDDPVPHRPDECEA